MIFTKTKVNESMVMDLEGPIHQTHHKFVGATMGARFLGCSSPKRNKEIARQVCHQEEHISH